MTSFRPNIEFDLASEGMGGIFSTMKIRSILFNILFYGATVVMVIVAMPILVMPYRLTTKLQHFWSWMMEGLLKHIVGITHRIEGTPPDHAVIFASKHQSAWETIFLYGKLGSPAPVFKRELIYLPILGLFFLKAPSIAIDRSAGRNALKNLVASAKKIKAIGDGILIYPQGTRVASGQHHPYHSGTYAIYKATGLPVVPIALNSGICWPRNSFIKKRGVIDVKLLPEIPAGLDRQTFMKRLEHDIETATDSLPK